MRNSSVVRFVCVLVVAVLTVVGISVAQEAGQTKSKERPWMNTSLSPDERANLVLKELTLDEKLSLLHGQGFPGWGPPGPNVLLSNGGAGFVLGIPRLG